MAPVFMQPTETDSAADKNSELSRTEIYTGT